MHLLEAPALDLADILVAKDLVGLTVEALGPLWMRLAQRHVTHRLHRFNQGGAVLRAAITRRLHARLDHMQGFPTAEHMAIGRNIRRITDRRAPRIDAHRGEGKRLVLAFIGLGMAAHAFPKMTAFKELKAGAVHRHRLKAVDEPEQLRPLPAKELTQLLDEG